jgi:hypothetical protein
MATQKTFAVAGVSTFKDGTKIRFANDAARVKILIKNGHTDIELIDLPRDMTKAEIAEYLFETDFAKGRVPVMDAIKDLAKKNKPAGKHAVRAKTLEEVMATPALV